MRPARAIAAVVCALTMRAASVHAQSSAPPADSPDAAEATVQFDCDVPVMMVRWGSLPLADPHREFLDTPGDGHMLLTHLRPGLHMFRVFAYGEQWNTFLTLRPGEHAVARHAFHPERLWARSVRACSNGVAAECVIAADLAADGAGAPGECARVVGLLTRACDSDPSVGGCYLLAERLRRGDDGPADIQRALALYRRGCTRGDRRACTPLARAYRDGTGVTADANRAWALFNMACGSDQTACTELEQLTNTTSR